MASNPALHDAVQAAVVAAAHASTYDRVSAALDACTRLGSLTSGQWRAAARDLERLKEGLQRALDGLGQDLTRRAAALGVEEETLWTVGEAAEFFDTVREDALDELDEDGPAARLLQSSALLGATLLDDGEATNRGSTLVFGWADPLQPAVWPWEANWVVASDAGDDELEELDLFEVGELGIGEELLAAVCQELGVEPQQGAEAVRDAAAALTRAGLLSAVSEPDDGEEPPGTPNGHV